MSKIILGIRDLLRQYLDVPIEYYFHRLPNMPHGETPAVLSSQGFPRVADLIDGVGVAVLLTGTRYFLFNFVFTPAGRYLMKHNLFRLSLDDKIEKTVREERFPRRPRVQRLSEELNMSFRSTDRRIRKARNKQREDKMLSKFNEVSWRLVNHLILTAWGAEAVLHRERWMYDPKTCWQTYPMVAVSPAVYWYYMSEFGVFVHEIIFLFVETRRSDFWAMFVHHVSTLSLIAGSYICNFLPIGSLVMITHDIADSFLETAKILNYISKTRPWAKDATDLFFILFAIMFFLTRLVLFPFHVFWRAALRVPIAYIGRYTGLDLLNVFLFVLICLHIHWMYLICKMAVKMARTGSAEKDTRSDDEEEMESSSGGEGNDAAVNGAARKKDK